jgi:hypothetical protein
VFVGASVSGEGIKRFLAHLRSMEEHKDVYLGLVGSTKFCFKDKLPGANLCGTGRHGASKLSAAWPTLYVKFTDTQVYTQPVVEVEALSVSQINVLLSKSFMLNEWIHFFQEIKEQRFPDRLPRADSQSQPEVSSDRVCDPYVSSLQLMMRQGVSPFSR